MNGLNKREVAGYIFLAVVSLSMLGAAIYSRYNNTPVPTTCYEAQMLSVVPPNPEPRDMRILLCFRQYDYNNNNKETSTDERQARKPSYLPN
jgi:hypothetical protein